MDPEECVICLEEYSNKHIPQLLPCSHMICDKCLAGVPNELDCPLCRNPCNKSEIIPNFDLFSKLMKENLLNLNHLQKQFEARLEEVVQSEIDKQLNCISKLNSLEKELVEKISKLKKKMSKLMDYNTSVKIQTMMKIEDDIVLVSSQLKQNLDILDFDEVSKQLKLIEKKYKEEDIMISLKTFEYDLVNIELEKILKNILVNFEFKANERHLCLFSENTVRLVHENPIRRINNFYASKILFNPSDKKLSLMNMDKKEKSEFRNNLIQSDSICYQLHPNTVCVTTSSNILYLDLNDNSIYTAPFRFNWESFCLGRFKGDLVIIGGANNRSSSGQEVLFLFKRKEWKALPPLLKPRQNATSESINNRIFVFGGNPDMTIEYFNFYNWQILSCRLKSAYSYIVSCTDTSSIYLLGGFTLNNSTNMEIFKFDTQSQTLNSLEKIHYEIFKTPNCSACCVKNEIYYNIGSEIFQYTLEN